MDQNCKQAFSKGINSDRVIGCKQVDTQESSLPRRAVPTDGQEPLCLQDPKRPRNKRPYIPVPLRPCLQGAC